MFKLNRVMLAFVLTALFLVGSILPVSAQGGDDDACTRIVTSALELSQEACDETGRNQACYGNITLLAEPQPGITNLAFEQRGDMVDVESVRTFQLSTLNREADEWGVAYLQLQANIPDDVLENITLLLFGDVGIENAVEPIPEATTIEVTATTNANVRGGPSTNNQIVGSVDFNQAIVADGRLEDSSWLRIRLEDDAVGWIFAQLVTSEEDIESLDILTADGAPPEPEIGPMQAFFVETGVDDAPCETAPDSGLLIQTPEGIAEINLIINEVDIKLRSTAYIQSQPNAEMIVNIIEGSARVAAQGQSVLVPAGALVRIPMDANNRASAPPGDTEPYDDVALAALPINNLPRTIAVAAALTEEELAEATASIDGEWVIAAFDGSCEGIEPDDGSTVIGKGQLFLTEDNGDIRGEPPGDNYFSDPFTAELLADREYRLVFDDKSDAFNDANEFRLRIIGPNNVDIVRFITFPEWNCTYIYSLEPAQ